LRFQLIDDSLKFLMGLCGIVIFRKIQGKKIEKKF
jgi:hypothetical protein